MRYLITFSYNGSKYNGYQKQPNKKTVQDELENALTQLNSNKIVNVVASGRTDAGVHAINQKAHFDLDNDFFTEDLKKILNKMLSNNIYIKEVKIVNDDFHARYNSKKKTYMYIVNLGEYDPFKYEYEYQYNKELDVEKMKEGIKYFIGEHNFKSYTKASDEISSYVRTIYDANIDYHSDKIIISFTGNGFLRYMVRNMVGALIEIGENKYSPLEIKEILEKEDRKEAGITAPPYGLYLKDVEYEKE